MKARRRASSWPNRRRPFPNAPRLVFFGTSAFAVPSLHLLAANALVALVVTQPDRPSGRGKHLRPTDVKAVALALGVPVIEPERLASALERLEAEQADVFVVVSYGRILSQRLLELPRAGALNVHPSLLPLYRGATPLQSAIRDGATESGVSVILMDAGMDTGDLVAVEATAVGPQETYGELHDRYAQLGATLVLAAVRAAAAGSLSATPQSALGVPAECIGATLTRPLAKEDLAIDWAWPAIRIARLVRSLSPQPLARANIRGSAVKLVAAHVAAEAERGLPECLECGEGTALVVDALVPPNRGQMSGATFFARASEGA